MSKRTIGLIVALLVITVILLAIALSNSAPQNTTQQNPTSSFPSPTPYAQSTLTFSPSQLSLVTGSTTPQHVDIALTTGANDVTGVQLSLAYDSHAFSAVSIVDGSLFPNPFVIFPAKTDPIAGTISYAYGITPSQQSHKGSGVVATLMLTPKAHPLTTTGQPITQTTIRFLPKTLVSARGVDQSVLNATTLSNALTVTFGTSGMH